MSSSRVLQLSDLHLNARREPTYGVDADRSLRLVLEACAHVDDLAAVVVTGDIADDGSTAAYDRARETLLAFTTERGARLVCCVGNHDDRRSFAGALGSGHFDVDGRDCGVAGDPDERICAVSTGAGVRVVTLDSLVPGKWYGSLGAEQLGWLDRVLADGTPTVVAMHHPPIDIGVEIQRRVGLQDRDALAAIVRPGTVNAILCGHFHQQIAGLVSGVPTWVTPGVFTRIDHLSGPTGTELATAGGGATLVDLTDPDAPRFATIAAADEHAGSPAYEVTLRQLETDLDTFGIPR